LTAQKCQTLYLCRKTRESCISLRARWPDSEGQSDRKSSFWFPWCMVETSTVFTMDSLRTPRTREQKFWEWRRMSPIRPVVFHDPGAVTEGVQPEQDGFATESETSNPMDTR